MFVILFDWIPHEPGSCNFRKQAVADNRLPALLVSPSIIISDLGSFNSKLNLSPFLSHQKPLVKGTRLTLISFLDKLQGIRWRIYFMTWIVALIDEHRLSFEWVVDLHWEGRRFELQYLFLGVSHIWYLDLVESLPLLSGCLAWFRRCKWHLLCESIVNAMSISIVYSLNRSANFLSCSDSPHFTRYDPDGIALLKRDTALIVITKSAIFVCFNIGGFIHQSLYVIGCLRSLHLHLSEQYLFMCFV